MCFSLFHWLLSPLVSAISLFIAFLYHSNNPFEVVLSLFFPSLLSCIWFLILSNLPSIFSRGPIRRQGSGSCPGAAGLSGWRRWCWGGLRCHTPLPFTLTLVPLSASTANVCWRVSSARECSVKVELHIKSVSFKDIVFHFGTGVDNSSP